MPPLNPTVGLPHLFVCVQCHTNLVAVWNELEEEPNLLGSATNLAGHHAGWASVFCCLHRGAHPSMILTLQRCQSLSVPRNRGLSPHAMRPPSPSPGVPRWAPPSCLARPPSHSPFYPCPLNFPSSLLLGTACQPAMRQQRLDDSLSPPTPGLHPPTLSQQTTSECAPPPALPPTCCVALARLYSCSPLCTVLQQRLPAPWLVLRLFYA
jgi:hypothetical protein